MSKRKHILLLANFGFTSEKLILQNNKENITETSRANVYAGASAASTCTGDFGAPLPQPPEPGQVEAESSSQGERGERCGGC